MQRMFTSLQKIFAGFQPKERIAKADIRYGMQMLVYDGACFQIMSVLTGGAFLVAFALLLGAPNIVIGVLAAAGPLTQMLQIPAIFLIESTRLRKATSVISTSIGRLFWIAAALTPWLLPKPSQVPVFVGAVLLYFGCTAVSGLGFNAWMRDLIPENIRGTYFGRRAAIATGLSAGLSLLAGIGVDYFKARFPEIGVYTVLFLIGAAAGLFGVYFRAKVPEPKMAAARRQSIMSVLAEPFRDKNFQQLLIFIGVWNFAINLAAPFFTVYMLQRLGLSMTLVLGLAVLSQMINALFFQLWGRLADRFSNKSVLAIAGPLFMLSIFLFTLTTMPETYVMTIPFLALIHILTGMSTAGIMLCAGNIALKLAPEGKATAYLATNALISGVAATIAPILGGIVADWFDGKELRLTLTWTSEILKEGMDFPAMSLRGLDFLFITAVVIGVYSLHRLALIKEKGEVEEDVVLSEFYHMVGRAFKHVSNVAGVRHLFYFPYGRFLELLSEDNLIEDENGLTASPGFFHVPSIQKKMDLSIEKNDIDREQSS